MFYVTHCKSARGKAAETEDREQFSTATTAFSDSQDAAEYADMLKRNGYKFVVLHQD